MPVGNIDEVARGNKNWPRVKFFNVKNSSAMK